VTAELVVLVPVLRRPHRVAPLLKSIRTATPDARVLFLPDPDDVAERAALRAAGAEQRAVAGNYAVKVNAGAAVVGEPLVFIGADDLTFHEGWFEAAKKRIDEGAEVVGVNDLIPRQQARRGHATHFLITREYAELPAVDGSRGPLFEGYDHSFTDDELIATATTRGVYAYADDAAVEHHHPMSGGEDDDVYRKGRARFHEDRRLFRDRGRLWK
jgi:hypothetical protein